MVRVGRHIRRLAAGLLLAVGVAICAVAALAWWGGVNYRAWAAGMHWAGAALTSRVFLEAALITVLSTLLFSLLAVAMWRAGEAQRKQPRSQEGNALIEFVLVFPIGAMLAMLMVQGTMLMAGNLCVHYAAYNAARAAVTTVPLNIEPDETYNIVSGDASSAKNFRIRMAAVYSVMPVSASNNQFGDANNKIPLQTGMAQYFDTYQKQVPGWVDMHLSRKWQYANDHTTIRLSPPANGVSYAPNEEIVVSMNHSLYMGVPYARNVFAAIMGNDAVQLNGNGEYAASVDVITRMSNEGVQDYVDVEKFP